MIQGRCPICGKAYEIEALDDLPTLSLLLGPLPAHRPRPLDRRRVRHPRPRGAYPAPGRERRRETKTIE